MKRPHNMHPRSALGSLAQRLFIVAASAALAASTAWWEGQIVPAAKAAVVGPDINVTADQFTVLGEWTYFRQFTEIYGDELWRTNGTYTELVRDIDPRNSPEDSGDRPESITEWKGWIWFVHGDNVHGNELWRSNGVTTELYLDRTPEDSTDNWGPNVHNMYKSDDHLYFYTPRGVERMDIAGNREVVFPVASCYLIPAVVNEYNPKNYLYTSVNGSVFGWCWEDDGGSGTNFEFYESTYDLNVKKITSSSTNCDCRMEEPRRQADGSWIASKSAKDGAPPLSGGGLQLIRISQDLRTVDYNFATVPGVDGAEERLLSEIDYETLPNGIIYVWGWDLDHGIELWKVDNSGNLSRISDINPGDGNSLPSELSRYGNTLLFTAGATARKLYYLDGETPVEIVPPEGVSMKDPRKLTVIDDTLFFVADDESDIARVYELNLVSIASTTTRLASISVASPVGFLRTAISGTPGLAAQIPAGAAYVGDESPSPLMTSSLAAYAPYSLDEEESVAALRVDSLANRPGYIRGLALIGTPRPNLPITADPGLWTGIPAPTYRYQWYLCSARQRPSELQRMPSGCRAIRGANASTYTPNRRDLNKYLRVLVHGTNEQGSRSHVSAPIQVKRR